MDLDSRPHTMTAHALILQGRSVSAHKSGHYYIYGRTVIRRSASSRPSPEDRTRECRAARSTPSGVPQIMPAEILRADALQRVSSCTPYSPSRPLRAIGEHPFGMSPNLPAQNRNRCVSEWSAYVFFPLRLRQSPVATRQVIRWLGGSYSSFTASGQFAADFGRQRSRTQCTRHRVHIGTQAAIVVVANRGNRAAPAVTPACYLRVSSQSDQ